MCEICQSSPHLAGCPNAKPETLRCVWCKDDVPASDIKKIGRDYVCGDCEAEYLAEKGDDFVESFVSEHKTEYFLKWWFDSFTDEEKTAMIKRIYDKYHYSDFSGEERFSDKSEFCLENDTFLDFVREGLNNAV